ncbi:uncharacterized protein LOC141686691 [Apium graveolens]|uniref:uncharacterized protein LOC141686691 n=1 Tax=Apium graveolens TaxID=4045 RepID=UPI003D7A7865
MDSLSQTLPLSNPSHRQRALFTIVSPSSRRSAHLISALSTLIFLLELGKLLLVSGCACGVSICARVCIMYKISCKNKLSELFMRYSWSIFDCEVEQIVLGT